MAGHAIEQGRVTGEAAAAAAAEVPGAITVTVVVSAEVAV